MAPSSTRRSYVILFLIGFQVVCIRFIVNFKYSLLRKCMQNHIIMKFPKIERYIFLCLLMFICHFAKSTFFLKHGHVLYAVYFPVAL